ncbi:MAG: hypothetical protein WBK19_13995 [Azonexus sp.]
MTPIDIPTIERQARELRAAEIRRLNGLFAERSALVLKLATGSALAGARALAETLRPLFAWNPQTRAAPLTVSIQPAVTRMNNLARSLFSWNPQARRS